MKKINIAVDGYSSCGKSTISKALAKKLGYIFIDTGAMYRSVTLYALENEIIEGDSLDTDKLVKSLANIAISFKYNTALQQNVVLLNGVEVEDKIRGKQVASWVSEVSKIKEVRVKLVEWQQEMGKEKGVVMDGRDIGTVVFPDAELKLFMTADLQVRAQRRYDELKVKGQEMPLVEVAKNLRERDYNDMNRAESPLKQARDARVIDTTNITPQQQLDIAYNWALEIIKN